MIDKEVFWSLVEKTDTCWVWKGVHGGRGYGRYKTKPAHRIAYSQLVGPIPYGMILHHVCKNRLCVNPVHLELTTPRDHADVRATILRNRTHCPQGHEYNTDNTLVRISTRGHFYRACRICTNAKLRKYRRKQRREACQQHLY